MHQLAIIGAGQLGSRHLQGLAKLALPCEIYVVDPQPASLDVARARFAEMPPNGAVAHVHYLDSVAGLPDALDYVIIATTANVRLAVLEALLARSSVRYLLLEKVLFQRPADFARAEALLAAHGVTAWVNCPRRIFPLYQEVQQFFGADPLLSLSVVGGNWGLACNSIHFIDLFAMLSGATPTALSAEGLDPGYVQSKRKDFIELSGTLRGRFGRTSFEVTSVADSQARIMLTMRGESRACLIDEAGGTGFFFDGAAWSQRQFRLPFLSEQATALATDILQRGHCDLPGYALSQACHLPLLAALSQHLAGTTLERHDATSCPIT